jgi:hypothetical protein
MMADARGSVVFQPLYINVLEVYAVCNLSDVSWGTSSFTAVLSMQLNIGTEGLDRVEHDLGVVHTHARPANAHDKDDASLDEKDGTVEETMEVSLPTDQADIDAAFDETCRDFFHPPSPRLPANKVTLSQEDYYRSVRTNTALAWVLSNVIVMIAVLFGGQFYADKEGDLRYRLGIRIYMVRGAPGGTDKADHVVQFLLLGFMSFTAMVRLTMSTLYIVTVALDSVIRKMLRRRRAGTVDSLAV